MEKMAKPIDNFVRLHSTQERRHNLSFQGNKVIGFFGRNWNRFNFLSTEVLATSFFRSLPQKPSKLLLCTNGSRQSKIISYYFADLLASTNHSITKIENDLSVPIEIATQILREKNYDFLIYFDVFKKSRESVIYIQPSDSNYFTKEKILHFNKHIRSRKILNHHNLPKQPFKTLSFNEVIIFSKKRFSTSKTVGKKRISVSFAGATRGAKRVFNEACAAGYSSKKQIKWSLLRVLFLFLKSLVFGIAFKDRSDVVLVADKGSNKIKFFFKTKNKYKYISNDELLAFFLYKEHKRLAGFTQHYVVFDTTKNVFLTKVAKSLNLTVVEPYGETIKDKNFLLGFSEGTKVLFDLENESGGENMLFAMKLLHTINSCKNKQIEALETIKMLEKKLGVIKQNQQTFSVKESIAEKIFEHFFANAKIDNRTIVYATEGWDNLNITKTVRCRFDNGATSWLSYNYITNQLICSYSEEIRSLSNNFDFLNNAKRFREYILTIKTSLEDKGFSLGSPKKYLLFLVIASLLLYYLFNSFFKLENSSSNVFVETWRLLSGYNHKTRFKSKGILFLLLLYPLVSVVFNAVFIKRAAQKQGENISLKHLIVGITMGIFFTNITPLPVGGELVTYWYLRRQGVKQSVLIVAISLGLLAWNILVLLLFAIIVPISLHHSSEIFASDPLLTSYLVIGIVFNFIWFIILFALSKVRVVQTFLINIVVDVLELLPHTNNKIVEDWITRFHSSVAEIRYSFNFFYKSASFLFEGLFWKFCAFFLPIIPALFFLMFPTEVLSFWNSYTKIALHRLLNTISITPGGVGISEVLFSKLMNKEITNANSLKTFNFVVNTFGSYFLPMLISLFTFTNVLMIEKLKVFIRKNNEKIAVLGSKESHTVVLLKNRIKLQLILKRLITYGWMVLVTVCAFILLAV